MTDSTFDITAYDADVLKRMPRMNGENGSLAVQEIHIFLAPINPNEEMVNKYNETVAKWNAEVGPSYREKFGEHYMKPCHLSLIFRKKNEHNVFVDNEIRVLQSATYCKTNSLEEVIAQSHAQAAYFKNAGFQVIREKIEASAYGIDSIPQTSESVTSGTYFEFHIKVEHRNKKTNGPITADELELLKNISNKFTVQFGVPVPLSFNNHGKNITINTSDAGANGYQRFLNVRFRNMGIKDIEPLLENIKTAINNTKVFSVIKVISELVWYDTLTSLDEGWIDFKKDGQINEQEELITYLRKQMRVNPVDVSTIPKYDSPILVFILTAFRNLHQVPIIYYPVKGMMHVIYYTIDAYKRYLRKSN